jgi:hypothetical protein
VLLTAEALVPDDQFHSSHLDENDFYLFGFLAGLEAGSATEMARARRAGQPLYLLYSSLPAGWRGAQRWRSLGRLVLKADVPEPIEVEVGGLNALRQARVERLTLAPRARVVTTGEFYSLLYLHAPQPPAGVVGVRSPSLRETVLVQPGDWDNIWIYGLEVFLAGWLTKAEFRAKSQFLPQGSSVWQYPRTQTANRAAPVSALRPVSELADLIRSSAWGRP